jgi:hypothetical protein
VLALTKGFYEVIPRAWVEMFDEKEFELMLCGLGAIDIADWRQHTDFRNCNADTPTVCVHTVWSLLLVSGNTHTHTHTHTHAHTRTHTHTHTQSTHIQAHHAKSHIDESAGEALLGGTGEL